MADPRGFLKVRRQDPARRPVKERVRDWKEMYLPLAPETVGAQATRCMDCGVPFCQGDTGCPVQNLIPEWNDLVRLRRWRDALELLHSTNNFPEFTGRLCPAPCETACVLGVVDDPVSIRQIELNIIEHGFADGAVSPQPPARETGKRVAIVGSGPAGLAAAQQLRREGHAVTVFEKADRPGGLLRYGIPDFKMEKSVIDRRLDQMRSEGVVFRTGVHVGVDVPARVLREEFDAICLAGGAEVARHLPVQGSDLGGIHLAMEFLEQQNRRLAGDVINPALSISARGKRVVVIGGGDTGSDCVGTCHRQGAAEVLQFELLPMPPLHRAESTPWPLWPMQLRTSHAHEEGGRREWSVSTTAFTGCDGRVRQLHAVRVEPVTDAGGRRGFQEIPGSDFALDVDLVLLAVGFAGPVREGVLAELGVALDARGNVAAGSDHMTSVDGVFAAGDVRLGASLIVWAIREGRDAARGIREYLRDAGGGMRDAVSPRT
ncbi:MAG TPA: glutamate synthase subunit beta [Gemmatimonadaceae bacterium]